MIFLLWSTASPKKHQGEKERTKIKPNIAVHFLNVPFPFSKTFSARVNLSVALMIVEDGEKKAWIKIHQSQTKQCKQGV
jgi:hypothetical protein